MWKVLFLKGDVGPKEMEQCSHIYKCVHRSFSGVLQVKKCVWSIEIYFCLKGQFCQKLSVRITCCAQGSALDEAEFQLLLHTQWFICAWFYPCYLHSFPTDSHLPGSTFILLSSFLPVPFDLGSPLFSGQVLLRVWNLVLGVHWGCRTPQQDCSCHHLCHSSAS